MQNFNSPEMQQPQNKKSNKWLFIIIGSIVVISILLVAAAIIGVAAYFIIKPGQPDYMPFEGPSNVSNVRTNQNSNSGEFSPTTPTDSPAAKASTDKLLKAIRGNSKVGRFKLQNVSPTLTDKLFNRSIGEVQAIYTSGDNRVAFVLAEYPSRISAVADVRQIIDVAQKGKANIMLPVDVSDHRVTALFSQKDIYTYAFCNWPKNKPVLCNLIISKDKVSVVDFNDALK